MGAGGMGAGHQQATPRQGYQSPGQQIVPPGYPGPRAADGAPPAAASPQQAVPHRSNGVTGMILGLGSMGIGIGATAAVVSHHVDGVAQVLIVLVVWLAIVVINIAHSQRR
jgi:predicted lipid-binding transport protein (Tim44 family)